jgi:hypothetical protein
MRDASEWLGLIRILPHHIAIRPFKKVQSRYHLSFNYLNRYQAFEN